MVRSGQGTNSTYTIENIIMIIMIVLILLIIENIIIIIDNDSTIENIII